MRARREAELAKKLLIHLVTSRLGNKPRIALKLHLHVTDTDLVQPDTGRKKEAQKAAHQAPSRRRSREALLERQEWHESRATDQEFPACAACRDIEPHATHKQSGEDRIRTCGPVTRSPI